MNIKGNLQQLHNPQLENTRQLHLFLIATTTAVTLQKYSIDLCIYNGKNKHTNNNSLIVATNADTFQILGAITNYCGYCLPELFILPKCNITFQILLIIIFKTCMDNYPNSNYQTLNYLCIILTIMYKSNSGL